VRDTDFVDHQQSLVLPAVRTLLEAAQFAAERHSGQRRKGASAEPYINHLIEVAHLVAGALSAPDTNLLIAALLHDVVEDTPVTRQELAAAFGADVATLVAEVTDDKSLPKQTRKQLQIDNAPKKSRRAQVIKLADKISNLRAILVSPPADWSEHRKREYVEWARRVVEALPEPNPVLRVEFERVYARFETNP